MKHAKSKSLGLAGAGMILFLGISTYSLAQNFPSKAIRFVVGFAPGGGTDLMARTLAGRLGSVLGTSVLVENRPAQSGMLAAQFVAKAPPDGYTLIMGTVSTFGVAPFLYLNPGYDAIKDFTPVIHCSTLPNVLAVHASVPAKSVRELVALAKAQPGKLNFASSGAGGGGHMSAELFKMVAGVDIVHVPYKGTSVATADLLAGTVHMSFVTIPPVRAHVESGKLRGLAVTGAKRAQAMPSLPTMAEAGFPGVVATSWNGVLAPAGTPRATVEKLNQEIQKILKSPEITKNLLAEGAEVAGGTPEEFAEFIRAEALKWQKVVKAAGIKPQ